MNDQAENLRKEKALHYSRRSARIIAVISGKGGVGKSNITLNFALALSEQGKKVMIFDLDIGMANLDILMGISPDRTLLDMVEEEVSIWDILAEGPGGVDLVPGGSGLAELFAMTEDNQERFSGQLARLYGHYDFILFDMGAGVSEESLRFILSANETIMITTPEPPAMMDAYAMLKHIHKKDVSLPCSLIVNKAETKLEGNSTAENFQRVSEKFLMKKITILGSVLSDKAVLLSVKKQKPFYLDAPGSEASLAVRSFTARYLGQERPVQPSGFPQFINQIKSIFQRRRGG
ncbi:MinD/ParA family protein [Alteribacillus sp. HJP-4]|uniref:MinD/ParA family protein n=1 Tax=Alteribacillus sp. HJP-4 TaxID=2775394 RepID=UPI0035CD31B0